MDKFYTWTASNTFDRIDFHFRLRFVHFLLCLLIQRRKHTQRKLSRANENEINCGGLFASLCKYLANENAVRTMNNDVETSVNSSRCDKNTMFVPKTESKTETNGMSGNMPLGWTTHQKERRREKKKKLYETKKERKLNGQKYKYSRAQCAVLVRVLPQIFFVCVRTKDSEFVKYKFDYRNKSQLLLQIELSVLAFDVLHVRRLVLWSRVNAICPAPIEMKRMPKTWNWIEKMNKTETRKIWMMNDFSIVDFHFHIFVLFFFLCSLVMYWLATVDMKHTKRVRMEHESINWLLILFSSSLSLRRSLFSELTFFRIQFVTAVGCLRFIVTPLSTFDIERHIECRDPNHCAAKNSMEC